MNRILKYMGIVAISIASATSAKAQSCASECPANYTIVDTCSKEGNEAFAKDKKFDFNTCVSEGMQESATCVKECQEKEKPKALRCAKNGETPRPGQQWCGK